MAICGAKTRSGQPCQAQAMPNGRCRMHGGKAAETHKGNQNARKHGIYSDALAEDEHDLWDMIDVESLDDQIKIAELQLRRALIAQSKAQAGDGLDLDSVTENSGSGEEGGYSNTSQQRRRRPYEDIINRLLGRIGDLKVKRAAMIAGMPPPPDGEIVPVSEYTLSPDEDVPASPVL
ncbi:HGGxSTG domain-containing protein [Pseudomonas sp. zfem003]|uniref:HGGxSTG domain-containing protein n=1 Tax=Pseudomonas sp. zfem003 TaxID=3078198 RepID=UPI002928442E|nr:HGGxSTG domain-containing protein [Pseudomonas sp. zfem003]MDU9398041.1 HGGxSTG domain-containing protein [Pseudomonas sp. zfem003]